MKINCIAQSLILLTQIKLMKVAFYSNEMLIPYLHILDNKKNTHLNDLF